MWEAYDAGTIPVGAVVVDGDGNVVSRGRNRMFDVAAERQFAATRLAHAEIDALVQLPSDRTYEDHTIYTALEPCHLCLAAAITVRIGALSYAAADPYGGAVGKLLPSHDHEAHPISIDGPLDIEAGRLPELLLAAHFLWRRPDGDVASFYRERFPEIVEQAQQLPLPSSGVSRPSRPAAKENGEPGR
jgi:tRNA(Arg) A34 adenosine deaminase TadA